MSEVKNKLMSELEHGINLGHTFTNVGRGILDESSCSCGWTGTSVWDDSFFAQEEWWTHVMEATDQGTQPSLPLVALK